MDKKDNLIDVNDDENTEKSTKTIGKFKNAEELHKAYNALEAEFTRRSQRLAEMERRSKLAADNSGTAEQIGKDESCCASDAEQDNIAFNAQAEATNLCGDIDCQEKNEQSDSDSEKDSKMDEQGDSDSEKDSKMDEQSNEVDEQGGKDSKVNAVGNSEQSDCNDKGDCKDTQGDDENESVEICENVWKEKVDKFFLENPKAQPFAKEIAQEMLDDKCLVNDANGLETAFSRFLVKSYKSPSELTASDEFLSRYVFSSEAIKNRIIEDYLFSLSHQKPPATIKSTGTTTLTPPSRPKTLQEAGWIFVRDNK